MRCIRTAECEQKVQDLDLRIDGQVLRHINGRAPASRELKIPDSARRQALGVNALFRTFPDDTNEWLLWALRWGTRLDEEYPELWYEIREHHGDSRSIIDAPGHLFSKDEQGLARAMTRLAMLFGWAAFLIPDPASFVVLLGEGEHLDLSASAGITIGDVATEITELWTKPW